MLPKFSIDRPLVSVLMTAFNSKEYIAEAITSIQEQTYENYELIIVDDNSSDDTFAIAKKFSNYDRKIKTYKNTTNLGDYANRSVAAKYARGKYMKYLDSDNILYSHALEVLVSSMEKYPDAGLGLCKIGEVGHPLPDQLSSREAYQESFFGAGLFTNAPSSTIIKSEAYHEVGGITNTRHRGDLELWLRLGAIYPVVRIPGILDWTRIHPNQESNKNANYKVGATYKIMMSALESVQCPLNEVETERAIALYVRRFLINTFIKRPLAGEFGIKDLFEIYKSLDIGRKELYRIAR